MELFKTNIVPIQTLADFYGFEPTAETSPSRTGQALIGPRIIGGIAEGMSFRSADSGARVEIFPAYDPTIGMIIYDDAGGEVFKALVTGDDVGDVIFGDYVSNQGIKYDKSAGTTDFKGSLTAVTGTFSGTVTASAFINSTLASTIETGAIANLPSDENLVAYWDFDEGSGIYALDSSGNGNTGTLTNMEAGDWIPGVVGTQLDFGGTDEYVDCGDPSFAANTSGGISFWITPGAYAEQAIIVYSKLSTGAVDEFRIEVNGANAGAFHLAIEVVDNTTAYSVKTPNGSIVKDARQFIEVTSDGSTWKIYIDSVLQTLTPGGGGNNGHWFGDLTADADVFTIGALARSSGYIIPYTGKLDEVRIYSTEPTAKEVYALYKNPSGAKTAGVPMGKLISGSIFSRQITLAVTTGLGDSYIRGGASFDMANWRGDDAFIIGLDDSDGNKAKFFIGNYANSKFLKYVQGGDLQIVGGAITASTFQTGTSGSNADISSGGIIRVRTGSTVTGFLQDTGGNGGFLQLNDNSGNAKLVLQYIVGNNEVLFSNAGDENMRFLTGSDTFIFQSPSSQGAGGLLPTTADKSRLGDSTDYWYSIHTNFLRYKDIDTFQTHNDIALIKNIKTKTIGEREVWDGETMPEKVYEDGFYDVGAMSGFLIGTFKQLIEKIETLELRLKKLE